jgi:hypothetical protein
MRIHNPHTYGASLLMFINRNITRRPLLPTEIVELIIDLHSSSGEDKGFYSVVWEQKQFEGFGGNSAGQAVTMGNCQSPGPHKRCPQIRITSLKNAGAFHRLCMPANSPKVGPMKVCRVLRLYYSFPEGALRSPGWSQTRVCFDPVPYQEQQNQMQNFKTPKLTSGSCRTGWSWWSFFTACNGRSGTNIGCECMHTRPANQTTSVHATSYMGTELPHECPDLSAR